MQDAFRDSSSRLARLLELVMRETDPEKCDELGIQIRRVLDEREGLRRSGEVIPEK